MVNSDLLLPMGAWDPGQCNSLASWPQTPPPLQQLALMSTPHHLWWGHFISWVLGKGNEVVYLKALNVYVTTDGTSNGCPCAHGRP
jgi:hypothetical protein